MKNKIILLLCFLFVITSCRFSLKDNEMLIVSINVAENSSFRLSEISDDIKKVALETSEECVIGHIAQIIYTDNRIFLLDIIGGWRIHIFDLSGKYLCNIDRRFPDSYPQSPRFPVRLCI